MDLLKSVRAKAYSVSGLDIGRLRKLPKIFAIVFRKVCADNTTAYAFKMATYDGSNQLVHPDFIRFKDNLLFCYTPYPLGTDFYENPCVAIGKDFSRLRNIKQNPLAVSKLNKPRCHCCDPCFFSADGTLYLCYLDVLNFDGKRECNFQYMTSADGSKWNMGGGILHFECSLVKNEHYLCPAVTKRGHKISFFCIHHYASQGNFDSELLLYESDGLHFEGKPKVCEVTQIPDGWYLWHINVCFYGDWSKEHSETDTSEWFGLFLLRKKSAVAEYKLFEARADMADAKWTLTREVTVPEELQADIAAIYKSSVEPDSGDVVVSYRDSNRVWKMAQIAR